MQNEDDVTWLTREVCSYYHERAKALGFRQEDVGARRELRLELQQKYKITEIEAINILNGFYADIYVRAYEYNKAKALERREEKKKEKEQKKTASKKKAIRKQHEEEEA